jgi:hypothetical protein
MSGQLRQGNGFPLNQNRNNNRRRGRGNNRGGQGGGNQGNRIDSRARGNAPQMLEKYRKLAHDASLNGDRVQTEYYLQFADHYFRVIADMRAQKDEQRPRRDNEREHAYDSPYEGAEEFDEFEDARDGRGRQQQHARRDEADEHPADEGERGAEGDVIDTAEPDDNPFTRDTRGRRSRGRSRPANDAGEREAESAGERDDDAGGFDPGILPPSIARDEEAPRRASGRGRRRPRPDEDGEEALEAVS